MLWRIYFASRNPFKRQSDTRGNSRRLLHPAGAGKSPCSGHRRRCPLPEPPPADFARLGLLGKWPHPPYPRSWPFGMAYRRTEARAGSSSMNRQIVTASPDDKREALAAILAAHPGNTCAVQCARIRATLSRFSLTTFEAMRHLDVYDPRARVLQLRKAGEHIDTHWTKVATESGHLHRVGVYVLGVSPC